MRDPTTYSRVSFCPVETTGGTSDFSYLSPLKLIDNTQNSVPNLENCRGAIMVSKTPSPPLKPRIIPAPHLPLEQNLSQCNCKEKRAYARQEERIVKQAYPPEHQTGRIKPVDAKFGIPEICNGSRHYAQEILSSRKRLILSRFAVRLENCFSHISLKRASTSGSSTMPRTSSET